MILLISSQILYIYIYLIYLSLYLFIYLIIYMFDLRLSYSVMPQYQFNKDRWSIDIGHSYIDGRCFIVHSTFNISDETKFIIFFFVKMSFYRSLLLTRKKPGWYRLSCTYTQHLEVYIYKLLRSLVHVSAINFSPFGAQQITVYGQRSQWKMNRLPWPQINKTIWPLSILLSFKNYKYKSYSK